ncbi:MAG: hypothetical protein ACOCXB_05415 [Halanaerobium sp.]
MNRPDWDDYFMEMAELAAKRASCLRKKLEVPSGQRYVICRGGSR